MTDVLGEVPTSAEPAAPTTRSFRRLQGGRSAGFDAWVRLTSALCLWAGLLLVSYWWIADGGVQDLRSWAAGITSLGRITGLLAAQLLLVQVLLMSRLPLLEHAFGRVRLAHLHRLIGLWSFGLMITHIVTIVAGYASVRWLLIPATLWQLLTDYAGVLLAGAGALSLIMVVATSIKLSRRRLRYESWHLLHLYGYLGVALALPHQLWTGQEFISRPAATVYWWGLWAATAGAVITWRIGLPLWRAVRFRLRVVAVTWEAKDVVSVKMTGRRLDRLAVDPGQFINVRFLTLPGWTRANPFSLSAAPDGQSLRITAKVIGDGTARIAQLRVGTPVLFEGPYGRLSSRARTRSKVLLAGAGVGITPLRALAEGLSYEPGDVVLLQRYGEAPLFAREFDRIRAERGLRVFGLPGRRGRAESLFGPITDGVDELTALLRTVPDLADHDVFVCGPSGWNRGMVRLMTRAGVPAHQIHVESFAW
ncbi:MAG TPA: ferric reductase-like transmembrane domain-containing protein [Microlunatus sp.]